MNEFGFTRVAACSPEVRVADVEYNVAAIKAIASEASVRGARLIVLPELSLTGYTCGDLFLQDHLLDKSDEGLLSLAAFTAGSDSVIVVGAPVRRGNSLYNCAVIMMKGSIVGVVPKVHIPNYGEFYEKRWFKSGAGTTGTVTIQGRANDTSVTVPFGADLIFNNNGVNFGIEICEDLWVPAPPSAGLCMAGAEVILNLSATNELAGKHSYLKKLIENQSARCRCAYVYASAGTGESSTDLAYTGQTIIAEDGHILAENKQFTMGPKTSIADVDIQTLRHDRRQYNTFDDDAAGEGYRNIKLPVNPRSNIDEFPIYRQIDSSPFLEKDPVKMAERCEEISSIQAWGLAVRLKAIDCRQAIIGISGGLDSTLALLITVKAFDLRGLDRKGIIGVTMPGYGTTERTQSNAERLMELLGVTSITIPIGDAVGQHFHDIGHDPEVRDVTYENSQARERTQILMDLANQRNAIVIGTGDLSELALGWCTYNGDHMSMYAVNASIPKTLVRHIVGYFASNTENEALREVLNDIIDTPISPELLPSDSMGEINQKTEDLVGPYDLHDFFLYHMVRRGASPRKIMLLACQAFKGKYDDLTIEKWLGVFMRRFFNQQFKRSCMPDGIKAGSVCLSPRGDWRMPSDASAFKL